MAELLKQHLGSSWTTDQTCVSCIGRWSLPLSQQEVLTRQLLKHKGRGANILGIFLSCTCFPSGNSPQYLGQSIIKNMNCYYRADFIRDLIHHDGMIADWSLCTIRVPFLLLPGPGTMFSWRMKWVWRKYIYSFYSYLHLCHALPTFDCSQKFGWK